MSSTTLYLKKSMFDKWVKSQNAFFRRCNTKRKRLESTAYVHSRHLSAYKKHAIQWRSAKNKWQKAKKADTKAARKKDFDEAQDALKKQETVLDVLEAYCYEAKAAVLKELEDWKEEEKQYYTSDKSDAHFGITLKA
jgi:hypothetical protein